MCQTFGTKKDHLGPISTVMRQSNPKARTVLPWDCSATLTRQATWLDRNLLLCLADRNHLAPRHKWSQLFALIVPPPVMYEPLYSQCFHQQTRLRTLFIANTSCWDSGWLSMLKVILLTLLSVLSYATESDLNFRRSKFRHAETGNDLVFSISMSKLGSPGLGTSNI